MSVKFSDAVNRWVPADISVVWSSPLPKGVLQSSTPLAGPPFISAPVCSSCCYTCLPLLLPLGLSPCRGLLLWARRTLEVEAPLRADGAPALASALPSLHSCLGEPGGPISFWVSILICTVCSVTPVCASPFPLCFSLGGDPEVGALWAAAAWQCLPTVPSCPPARTSTCLFFPPPGAPLHP